MSNCLSFHYMILLIYFKIYIYILKHSKVWTIYNSQKELKQLFSYKINLRQELKQLFFNKINLNLRQKLKQLLCHKINFRQKLKQLKQLFFFLEKVSLPSIAGQAGRVLHYPQYTLGQLSTESISNDITYSTPCSSCN